MSFVKNEVKPEHSGKRELFYNLWHRTLGKGYWMVDLDCVESRRNRGIVAIIARSLYTGKYPKDQIFRFKYHELQVLSLLREKTNIPTYFVFYYMKDDVVKALNQICQERQNRFENFDTAFIKSLKLNEAIYQFDVYEVKQGRPYFLKKMNNEEYSNFIKSL